MCSAWERHEGKKATERGKSDRLESLVGQESPIMQKSGDNDNNNNNRQDQKPTLD